MPKIEMRGAQIYLTSETSIPESDGNPLMKTQSRTSKKSPPIEGIIYNVIRELGVERQWTSGPIVDCTNETRNFFTPEALDCVTFYFYGSIFTRTKLRLICAADKTKFIILLLKIILKLSHKESEIGGFPNLKLFNIKSLNIQIANITDYTSPPISREHFCT